MLKLQNIEKSSYLGQLMREYDMCKNDPVYFWENYYDCLHFDESIKLDIDVFQNQVFDAIMSNQLTYIEGEKNTTKTTLVSSYAVWTCMFKQSQSVLYLTKSDINRHQVMDKMVASINMMPSFLFNRLPRLTISYPQDLVFEQLNSRLQVRESCDFNNPYLCDNTYDLLVVDDLAYYDDSFRCDNLVTNMVRKNENMKVIIISSSNPSKRNAFDENMKILQRSFVPFKQAI